MQPVIVIPVSGEPSILVSPQKYSELINRWMVEGRRTLATGVLEHQITGETTADDVRAYARGVYWLWHDTVAGTYFNQLRHKWVPQDGATAFSTARGPDGSGRKWILIEES